MKRILRTATLPVRLALRSQRIGLVFYTHGLGGTLSGLGIEVGRRGMTWAGRKLKPVPFDAVVGRRLAQTFAKLGPTFIKLGQVLSSRPDLVGDPAAEELKVLLDKVPPIPFREVERIVAEEVGKRALRDHLESIEPTPLASASISQTHRALMKDGTPIILKVQKTGAGETVRLDLILLEALVRSVHLVYPALQLLQAFNDFKAATLREIDYREEAKNIDRFRRNYQKIFSSADVVFPRYFPELTTERVIALEPMHGKKVAELRPGTTVARNAASLGLAAVLQQIFEHGFFHADPHAGNLFFLEDSGRIGFIDLGLVGQLDPEDKRKFLKVLLAILQRDRKTLARSLYELGVAHKRTDYAKFERDIEQLLDEVAALGVDKLRMDQMVNRLFWVARQNRLRIPNRYVLMIRSCLLIEGVAKALDPQISLFKIATPIVAKSLMKSYSPLSWIKRVWR